MFAALYKLLAHESAPTDAQLRALGFEASTVRRRRDSDNSEVVAQQLIDSTDTSLKPEPDNADDSSNEPDWTFPLVIITEREAQNRTDPEQHLRGVEAFENADDKPLGDSPPMVPLMSRRALSRALLQGLTQPTKTGRIDARRLSERAAAHRTLTPVPRLHRETPIPEYWLLIDNLPELAWDVEHLQQQLLSLPASQRPQQQIRLTDDTTTWFDVHDEAHAWANLPFMPEGVGLLVAANLQSLSAHVIQCVQRLTRRRNTVTSWLSPMPHRRAFYWGDNVITSDDHTVVEQLKTILWPFTEISAAMVRDCRLALGGSTAAEQAFWQSIADGSGDLLMGNCAVRRNRKHYRACLIGWVEDDLTQVQQLYSILEPHIRAMKATFRHRAVLNLPDALAGAEKKNQAEDFFESLAQRVKEPTAEHRQKMYAVILQMANGLVNEPSERTDATIRIGQRGYSEFDVDSAVELRDPADALGVVSAKGYIALTPQGAELTDRQDVGVVAAMDVGENGVVVECHGQRSRKQIGDSLPAPDCILHTPSERIHISHLLDQQFQFAESLWQDKDGLHLKTQEHLRISYPNGGGGPVFDTSDAPGWQKGCEFGIDQYGLWSELDIAGVKVQMRWIAPGRFLMGSPESELDRQSREVQHEVTLTQGYWLAETTCTQELWEAVMGENPSEFKAKSKPVERVSWDDVQTFFDAVKQLSVGLNLALPTEAQWEYACRAGTQTAFNLGSTITTEQVNYGDTEKGEYREMTVEAKTFEPNNWGLYQMHGNVYEWCQDWYGEYEAGEVVDPSGAKASAESSVIRVLRGGGWIDDAQNCRSACRYRLVPAQRGNCVGFRFAQVTRAQAGAERPKIRKPGNAKAPRSGNSRGVAGRILDMFTTNKKT